jgi:polyhydroxyalkanoate synthesis regulator phasin
MVMKDEFRRMGLFSSGVAELSKQRAEGFVKDLVNAGDVGRRQASSIVKDLMEATRQNRHELMRFVRAEVKSQLEGLGVASKRDVERLERRINKLEIEGRESRAAKKPTGRKTPAKTTGRKRTTQRGTGATKPPIAETPPTT